MESINNNQNNDNEKRNLKKQKFVLQFIQV